MKEVVLRGRAVNPGRAEGEAVVTKVPFSFLGELDPSTGVFSAVEHDLYGKSVRGKVLVCPTGKGSSAGPTIAWLARVAGNAPKAMICVEVEPVIALAALTANIPTIDKLDKNPIEVIRTGDYLIVDADHGLVRVKPKS